MKYTAIVASAALLFITACASSSNETQASSEQTQSTQKAATTPAKYCQSVGGQVKTVKGSSDAFCLLPGGEIVKLQTFYDNNH